MKKRKIKGKVVFQNLSGGFWGVVDQSGNEWRPVNMPEQLKLEGKEALQLLKIMEGLEEHDDVQNVYSNFDIPDDIIEQAA